MFLVVPKVVKPNPLLGKAVSWSKSKRNSYLLSKMDLDSKRITFRSSSTELAIYLENGPFLEKDILGVENNIRNELNGVVYVLLEDLQVVASHITSRISNLKMIIIRFRK